MEIQFHFVNMFNVRNVGFGHKRGLGVINWPERPYAGTPYFGTTILALSPQVYLNLLYPTYYVRISCHIPSVPTDLSNIFVMCSCYFYFCKIQGCIHVLNIIRLMQDKHVFMNYQTIASLKIYVYY